MIMKSLRLAFVGLFLSFSLSAQAVPENIYNGVWYTSSLGYMTTTQSGNQLAGTLLYTQSSYLAFFGELKSEEVTCEAPCVSGTHTIGMVNQLFLPSGHETSIRVDFGIESSTAPSEMTITVLSCTEIEGASCLLPVGTSLTIQRIL